MNDSNPQALKHLFGRELLKRTALAISGVYPTFDQKKFLGLIKKLEVLEMKPRVQLLRETLRQQLPQDYRQSLQILLESTRTGKLKGFDLWPYSDFVQTYGLEAPELSLDALKELTLLFSSEFAVRPFLKRYPELTLKFLERCAQDRSVDVRRWASEGTRPRLPWGERLHEFVKNPAPTLRILEMLKFDSELYVRKSVSNHLNDITKDHPELVIQVLEKWKKGAGKEHSEKVAWIIHRSLRTLIKNGHSEALRLIGVSCDAQIKLRALKINQPQIKLGEKLEFGFRVQSLSEKPQNLVIDYIVHFMKANQSHSPKVFKLKKLVLPPETEITISKSHHMKPVTTRVYYPGIQLLEIQVNGRVAGRTQWELKTLSKTGSKSQS